LSYNLMRMVNSVASGLPQKINSIKHGIVVLGRKQLQRWVQLLLYTAARSDSSM
jgi:EAL and modified HD-GYP domain-containing signal transduction protein